MYSDYPCMLVGNKLIHKNNINTFLKQVTDINKKVPENRHGDNARLETLCMTQLNLVTVSESLKSDISIEIQLLPYRVE